MPSLAYAAWMTPEYSPTMTPTGSDLSLGVPWMLLTTRSRMLACVVPLYGTSTLIGLFCQGHWHESAAQVGHHPPPHVHPLYVRGVAVQGQHGGLLVHGVSRIERHASRTSCTR